MGRASITAYLEGTVAGGTPPPRPLCFRWVGPNLVSARPSKRPVLQVGAAKDTVSEKVTPARLADSFCKTSSAETERAFALRAPKCHCHWGRARHPTGSLCPSGHLPFTSTARLPSSVTDPSSLEFHTNGNTV